MKRLLGISFALCVVLTMFSSCRAISRLFHGDEVVAEVNDVVLYRSDLNKVLPAGLSQEDSILLAGQYIDSWASDQVFTMLAEEQLSKEAKDVSKELEEYRQALLKYRYEQLYVNERLDTSVTEAVIKEFYTSNSDKFILDRPILKARYLSISTSSPALKQIRAKMSSSEPRDVWEADSLAYSSAMKFRTWEDKWIDISVIATEFGLDNSSLLSRKNGKWIEKVDTLGLTQLAYIIDMKDKGEVSPMEYCAPKIKDMILSARKQQLLKTLEQDLLEGAREKGQFKTY